MKEETLIMDYAFELSEEMTSGKKVKEEMLDKPLFKMLPENKI